MALLLKVLAMETDYSKNKEGDVYVVLNDYPKYPTRIKLERKE